MALKIQGQTVIDDDRGLSDISQIGIGTTANPTGAKLLVDVGSGTTAVTVQGSEGQLFSVTNELTTGSIFSVNDVSGIPSIDVDADGTILVAPYSTTEKVGFGTTSPAYKMDVVGDINFTGTLFQNGTEYTSGIASLTNDTSPVLGADLDANSNNIFGVNNLNVTGISTFQGNVKLLDSDTLSFGDGEDFRIGHYFGNNSITMINGNLSFVDSSSNERLKLTNNGDWEIKDNQATTRLKVIGTGVSITGDIIVSTGGTIGASSGIVTYYGDGSNLTGVQVTPQGTDTAIQFNDNSSFSGIASLASISTSTFSVGIGTIIDIKPYDTQNSGTLSFEASAGQLFSITNNLTSGSIFSVNDVSGIPSIDVDADGTVLVAPYSTTEKVGIGTTNPQYKFHVVGNTNIDGTFTVNGSAVSGGGGALEAFKTISVSGQSDVVADSATDTLTLVAGNNMTITTNAGSDSITFAASGGGGSGVASTITVADESSDTTCFPVFSTAATGDVNPKTGSNLTFNSSNGTLTATEFSGGGSGLTGVLKNVVEDTTPQLGGNLDLNSKDITGTGNLNILGVGTFSSLDPISVTIKNSRFLYLGNSNEGSITYDAANLEIATSSGDLNLKGSGSVALYEASSKKFETTGAGVTVTGDLIVSNNARITGILTVGSSSITLNGTDNSIHGFDALIAPPKRADTINISVTVGSKTTANRYYDQGSSNCYFLNGIEAPFLTLTPGRTYRFTLSSSDMTNHPFRLYLEADKTTAYTTNVTSTATYTEIVVNDTTPSVLHYQCSVHSLMGNSVQLNSNKVDTPYRIDGLNGANITGVVTATSFVKSSNSSGFLKADGTEDTNTYLTSLGTAILDGDFTSNGFMKRTGQGTYAVDSNTYLTSYTETDPVVGAINGIVKANGSGTISAATSGTDYLTPSGDGSSLTNLTGASAATYGSSTVTPVIVVDANGRITGISTVATSGSGGGGGDTVSITSTAADILSVSSGAISGDDAGADKIVFWDDSAGKLTYLTVGTNLSISGTTISASGGSGSSTTRSVNRYVATNNQTLFPPSGTVSYTVGYIDVYLNGSKLDSTEFTASNGTTITLTTGASANDIVELIAYTNINVTDVTVVNDTTPQLGGDLDLNGNDITGSGNISINGNQVATQNDAIAFAIALG